MGEFAAWGIGLALGYATRPLLTAPGRVLLFVIAIFLLGGLVTLASGEMATEPWLVLLDVGQVAVAALLGAFALPFAAWLRDWARRPAAR
jgi:hypothetical protein